VGLSPGDASYPQPYFYVGPYPHPPLESLRPLASGHWHREGWLAAVLTADELIQESASRKQEEVVRSFVDDAIAACLVALE
jgi:hypothetical protein